MNLPQIDLLPESEKAFLLIAGPCVIENEETPFMIATQLKKLCQDLGIPLVFKASYRKANRSRGDSFRGIGDSDALDVLAQIRSNYGIPTTTDIHSGEEAATASQAVDIVQIPAFLCRQSDVLEAAAATGVCVNIKKGQFLSPDAMRYAVEKVTAEGNHRVIVTERGTTFGYQDLVVDFRGIPIMKQFASVVLDCTHSLQRPNQSSGITGGDPKMIETMACAGLAAGVDGLFIETHPDPGKALSDGASMLPLDEMESLLRRALAVYRAIHG